MLTASVVERKRRTEAVDPSTSRQTGVGGEMTQARLAHFRAIILVQGNKERQSPPLDDQLADRTART